MEFVASVSSKIMKHPRKIHFTRSTKVKSFNNRKSNLAIKSNRFHRSNSLRNSLKSDSRSKSQAEFNNIINNNEIENSPFHPNYKTSSLKNSLKLKTHKSQELKFLNNNEAEPLEQSVLGAFTR